MTNDELKQALFNGVPVKYDDGRMSFDCKCVSAIIYRNLGNKIIIQAELRDKRTNSVYITNPRKVEFLEEAQHDNAS